MKSQLIEKVLLGIEEGEYLLSVLDDERGMMSGQEGHDVFGTGEGYKKLHSTLTKKFPLVADEDIINRLNGVEILTNEKVKTEAATTSTKVVNHLYDVTVFVSDTTEMFFQLNDTVPPDGLWDPSSRLLAFHFLKLLSCLVRITLVVASYDQLRFIVSVYALLTPEANTPSTAANRVFEDVKTFINCKDFGLRLQESLQNMAEHVAALVALVAPLIDVSPDDLFHISNDHHPLYSCCLFRGQAINWMILALYAVPSSLRQAPGTDESYNGFGILRKLLLDGYCVPLVGTMVFHTHKEFKEILKKKKMDQKESEGKNLTSTTSEQAVSGAWLKHREHRRLLIYYGKRLLKTIEAESSVHQNVNKLLCVGALIKDEILWLCYHRHNKSITKVAKYNLSHYKDEFTSELLSLLSQSLELLEQQQSKTTISEKYLKLLNKLSLNHDADLLALRSIYEIASKGSSHGSGSESVASQLTCGFFMSKLTNEKFTDWVRKLLFIPELSAYKTWYTSMLEDAMQCKDLSYVVADIISLTKTFVDSVHPYRDDGDFHTNGRAIVEYAESLLKKVLSRIGELLLAIKDAPHGLASLSSQVNGSAAARVFQLSHMGDGHIDKRKIDSLFPQGWVIPGSESLNELVSTRESLTSTLSAILTSLNRHSSITIYDKKFFPAEHIRLLLINDMRNYLSSLISNNIDKVSVNTDALLESVRHCHLMTFQVSQFCGVSSEDVMLQVLLSEFTSPQCWDVLKTPSPTHNNIAYRLAMWISRFTRNVTKEKLMFSTRRKVFVPTDSSKVVEDFLVPSDWNNLSIIGGGYTVRLIDSLLLEQIGELLKAIQKSAIKLKPVCETYETHGIDRDMEKTLQESTLLSESIHLSIVLLVRQLLYDGLSRNMSRRSVALRQAIQTQYEQDSADPNVAVLSGIDITSDPVIENLYKNNLLKIDGSDTDLDLSHLPISFGLLMVHSIWSRSGEFDTLRNGWKTNVHCLDTSLRHMFKYIEYSPPLDRTASYSKAMTSYARTSLAIILSRGGGTGREDQTYLNQLQFLKRLVRSDKSLSAKVLVDHCPHSLLREVDMLAYFKGDKER